MSLRYVRSGPPRVMRSPMTGTWYVVSAPYSEDDADPRYVIASRKREVHPTDAAELEALYQSNRRSGALLQGIAEKADKEQSRDE